MQFALKTIRIIVQVALLMGITSLGNVFESITHTYSR